MRLRIYSVFDKAVSAYLAPMMMRSEEEAIRSFQEAVANQGHQFSKHRKDYCLAHLGFFDDSLGAFECDTPPRVVAEALTVLAGVDSPLPSGED